MDSKQAAAYLGISPSSLWKLTAARDIPFEQDKPGGKCWFKRSELDAWRAGTSR
jgi:excisionase family DNA binding protein